MFMKKSHLVTAIVLISALVSTLTLTGCTKKLNKKGDSSDAVSDPDAEATATAGAPDPITGMTAQPYTFEFIAHGENCPSGGGYYTTCPGTIHPYNWSSSTLASENQSLFITDSRLHIRVLPKSSPGQVPESGVSDGRECHFMGLPYNNLKIKIGVKAKDAADYLSTHTFPLTAINGTSESYSFLVPENSWGTSSAEQKPFIVEIVSVHWDYNCGQGLESCQVWKHDCYEIEIQMATDYTKGFY